MAAAGRGRLGALGAAKPERLWVPSQNGLMPDFPHRHSATVLRPGVDLGAVLVDQPEVPADDQRAVAVGRDGGAARRPGQVGGGSSAGGSAGTAELTPQRAPAVPPAHPAGHPAGCRRTPARRPSARAGWCAVLVEELPGVDVGAGAAGPGDAGQLQPGPGQLVAGPAADEEDGVAGAAGQLPRLAQRVGRRRLEQPARGQLRERPDRRGHPQRGVLAGVLQLQQLGGPLDVGQPAAAQLGVRGRVRAPRQPLPLDSGLDPADLGDLLGRHAPGRVADRVDELDERRAQGLVAGHGDGAQQGLHLPHRHPAVVVLAVGVQAAHQRPLPALGPQVGVELEGRIRCRLAEQPAQRVRDRVGRRGRLPVLRARPGPVHEQHVGVRAVAHLPPAEPAHADDGEVGGHAPRRRPRLARRARRDVQADLQRGDGDVVSRRGDLPDVEHAEQVRGGDPQQLVPAAARAATRMPLGVRGPPGACPTPREGSRVRRAQLVGRRRGSAAPRGCG
jgi:hypothetical protein